MNIMKSVGLSLSLLIAPAAQANLFSGITARLPELSLPKLPESIASRLPECTCFNASLATLAATGALYGLYQAGVLHKIANAAKKAGKTVFTFCKTHKGKVLLTAAIAATLLVAYKSDMLGNPFATKVVADAQAL